MLNSAPYLSVAVAGLVLGGAVSYEGNSFPDDAGWTRRDTLFTADRFVENRWFVQRADIIDPGPPVVPEEDFYDQSLASFAGAGNLFVAWRVETDGPREGIEGCAPAVLAASGRAGIFYHFTVATDQVRFLRDPQAPIVWVDIEPGVAHTYYLELHNIQHYAWYVDAQLIDAGVPSGPYPTDDSFVAFGASAVRGITTTRWDYIRFGIIPEDGSGDYDSDQDVDGRDFYFFHECLTNLRPGINGGPGNDAGPGCRFADFDSDSDVDLLDYAAFQLTFTDGE